MRDWKVYANCCVRPKGMRVVETFDIDECIQVCVNEIADSYDWDSIEDSDEAVNNVYESIWDELLKRYEKDGRLDCGDYRLIRSDDMPTDIPNEVGYEIF